MASRGERVSAAIRRVGLCTLVVGRVAAGERDRQRVGAIEHGARAREAWARDGIASLELAGAIEPRARLVARIARGIERNLEVARRIHAGVLERDAARAARDRVEVAEDQRAAGAELGDLVTPREVLLHGARALLEALAELAQRGEERVGLVVAIAARARRHEREARGLEGLA